MGRSKAMKKARPLNMHRVALNSECVYLKICLYPRRSTPAEGPVQWSGGSTKATRVLSGLTQHCSFWSFPLKLHWPTPGFCLAKAASARRSWNPTTSFFGRRKPGVKQTISFPQKSPRDKQWRDQCFPAWRFYFEFFNTYILHCS